MEPGGPISEPDRFTTRHRKNGRISMYLGLGGLILLIILLWVFLR
jgi:hypothetical protein